LPGGEAPRILAARMRVAQTNLQLYNQLRERGLALNELVLVHRAYELLTTLYAAHYQADGKPFVAHGVGVASILAELDQPAEMLAVGLLHNVYGNADFGDGQGSGPTPSRRRLIRNAVGPQVEELLVRFPDLRIRPANVQDGRRSLPGLDDAGRRLVLVDLADHLEKYVDLGVLYFGDNDWLIRSTDRIGSDLIEIAHDLGQPQLAEMLSSAIAEAVAQMHDVPAELRTSDGRKYLRLVVPRSCRRVTDAGAGEARPS
jgi:(p)ppGpp synthase/HD superfamily hydrolase